MTVSVIHYRCRTKFDDQSIRTMFKSEYFAYEKKLIATRLVLGAILILTGVFFALPTALKTICLLIGAWLIVALDFPSKVRSEGIIESRGGAVSQVHIEFTDTAIQVEKQQSVLYVTLDKLVDQGSYFILFQSKQNAVMVDKKNIDPCDPEAFKHFIEEKTGKTFQSPVNMLSMNLFDLIAMFSNSKKH